MRNETVRRRWYKFYYKFLGYYLKYTSQLLPHQRFIVSEEIYVKNVELQQKSKFVGNMENKCIQVT